MFKGSVHPNYKRCTCSHLPNVVTSQADSFGLSLKRFAECLKPAFSLKMWG